MSQTRSARLVCPCGAPVASSRQPPGAADPDTLWAARVVTCPGCRRLLIADDPNVGRVINAKWKLVNRLGQGGMGSVYLAEDLATERRVALKFLHPRLVERDEYRERFEREAKVMGRVEHPNLAKLFGVEHLGATPFLVMKFVPGTTLTRVMKQRKVLPLAEAVEVVRQIGAGLAALHGQGYVHRDLKPGNVIVGENGHVTLLDFGLTRSNESALTRPGVAMGSPHFMSPEQVTGGALDGRSDLYALGLLTSELLTGKRPYPDAPTQVMLLQHLNDAPVPANVSNPEVPAEVGRVVVTAMAKRPADRQASVQVFVQELLAASRLRDLTNTSVLLPAPAAPLEPEGGRVAEEVTPETASLASAELLDAGPRPAVADAQRVTAPRGPLMNAPAAPRAMVAEGMARAGVLVNAPVDARAPVAEAAARTGPLVNAPVDPRATATEGMARAGLLVNASVDARATATEGMARAGLLVNAPVDPRATLVEGSTMTPSVPQRVARPGPVVSATLEARPAVFERPGAKPAEPQRTVVARPGAMVTEPVPAWERTDELGDDLRRTEDLRGALGVKTEAVDAWNDVTELPSDDQRALVEEARRHHQRPRRALVIAGLVAAVLLVGASVWVLLH